MSILGKDQESELLEWVDNAIEVLCELHNPRALTSTAVCVPDPDGITMLHITLSTLPVSQLFEKTEPEGDDE